MLSLSAVTKAQFSKFHAGITFPLDRFGRGYEKQEIILDEGGFAATGYNIGYKRYALLSDAKYSWGLVFGAEAFYNGLNTTYKNYMESVGWEKIIYPTYLNFPITLGLYFVYPLEKKAKIYGEMGSGINFSVFTKYSLANRIGYQDMEYKYKLAVGCPLEIEGGVIFFERISIGLIFNHLDSYRYKYEVKYEQAENKKDKYKKVLPITFISLCSGIVF